MQIRGWFANCCPDLLNYVPSNLENLVIASKSEHEMDLRPLLKMQNLTSLRLTRVMPTYVFGGGPPLLFFLPTNLRSLSLKYLDEYGYQSIGPGWTTLENLTKLDVITPVMAMLPDEKTEVEEETDVDLAESFFRSFTVPPNLKHLKIISSQHHFGLGSASQISPVFLRPMKKAMSPGSPTRTFSLTLFLELTGKQKNDR
eukprot:TRINITY_DN1507_c0_g1_i1.p1 TRINITY_DN1507_c0_g1~~TRINITY_DN1507_c0_g1_i1.p1  ORF type:complete len:200 (-),score=30.61 TRINITY_DN1507_c0_g1_i1:36-635(-)